MRILCVAAIAVALSGVTAASDTDTFTVSGTNPDGAPYTGTVTLTEVDAPGKVDGDVFNVVWTIGADIVEGIGIVSKDDRKTLALSYPANEGAGVMIITQTDAGMSGVWFIKGMSAVGTETWTPAASDAAAATSPPPTATPGDITYDRAVECAAATSFVLGTLRVTPGADAAKIDAYDKANSAWIMKLGDIAPADKTMSKRIADIKAKQQTWSDDPDGMTKATPIADDCVATAPPIE